MNVAGLLLAAGEGKRFGMPKALVELNGEPLVRKGIRVLHDGGCSTVTVVIGAQAARVRTLLPPWVTVVEAVDWREGMGASLRTGLEALTGESNAVLVHLVDLPGVGAPVVAALLGLATETAVVRPSYQGKPGHPVLFGSAHIADIHATLHGDAGAREWLAARTDITEVECGHLGTGHDIDTPADLPANSRHEA